MNIILLGHTTLTVLIDLSIEKQKSAYFRVSNTRNNQSICLLTKIFYIIQFLQSQQSRQRRRNSHISRCLTIKTINLFPWIDKILLTSIASAILTHLSRKITFQYFRISNNKNNSSLHHIVLPIINRTISSI